MRGAVSPAERSKAICICDRALAAYEKPLLDCTMKYDSADEIRAEIDVTARWAASHLIIPVVTEFGGCGAVTARHLRSAWRCAVCTGLETRSFGWTALALGGASDMCGKFSRDCGSDRLVDGIRGLCDVKSALGRQ